MKDLRDWFVLVACCAILLGAWSCAGSEWLPVTGGAVDSVLWALAGLVTTLALIALARGLRRRRYGNTPSSEVNTLRRALWLIVSFWFGLACAIALVIDAFSTDGAEGIGIGFFGLVGVALLVLCVLQVRRYVVRE